MHGKWSKPGVPHKGWQCVGIYDNGSDDDICEMCETTHIRWAHIMTHSLYSDDLHVGCICAGHMEDDYNAAKAREAKAQRHAKWLARKWRKNYNGEDYLNAEGFNVRIYRIPNGWGARVKKRGSSEGIASRRIYPTSDAAKIAAFDQMQRMKGRAA